jgi:Stress responsive A/B Barrel Domain
VFLHLFVFRWKTGVLDAQKERAVSDIRGFIGVIPGLIETLVGENTSPHGCGYGLGGVMKFVSEADYVAYSAHPAHQALLSWLMPLIDAIEVDFSIQESACDFVTRTTLSFAEPRSPGDTPLK